MVDVIGDIDVHVALTLSETLYANLLDRVVFDLRRVSSIDAGGRAVIAMAWDRITAMGGCVRLVASKELALDFLKTTRLSTFLEVFVSLEEATTDVAGTLSAVPAPNPTTVEADRLQDIPA